MLNYKRRGNGEVLVMVHGFLGSLNIFSDVMNDLSSQFDIVVIDLPGHGQSKIEKDSYSVYDYANAVAEILEHEGIREATWLGHSMGGYIVLAALEKNIATINRAILAYSSDLSDSNEQIEKRSKQQKQISDLGVKEFVDEVIGAFFSENAQNDKIEFAKQIAYQASPEGLIIALESMKSRPNQHQFVEQMSTPLLVIEGTEDKVVKPIITSNPNVQKVYTDTGHLGMLEDPKKFISAIYKFMKNV
ncbi:alpha/beta fold hydrolase [Ureibacillus acetophenoni]|uniref:Pimeloyl-ACP methyl ester carboxylesterase n=1 Tax=Ureibacillus acetophenoni TaxID=614649 RepID=A0A285UFF0_9BACL|nr:alpha/beta hydrolase [Ureibacillus acetophenoni]SOC40664.1 pimeloyl-ACP methyl ester carboxylesterase [Ureibacillus acetophenoni]